MSISKLKTKFAVGAWINNVKHYFEKINEIIDYLNANTRLNYVEYNALLSQSSTNAPRSVNSDGDDSDPFEDGIQGVWTYDSTGVYTYTKSGGFPDGNKVSIIIPNANSSQAKDVSVTGYWSDVNTLRFYVGVLATISTAQPGTLTDGKLARQPIIIRIYP